MNSIYIKNMVCNRCVKVVKEEFEKIGVSPLLVELGKVNLKEPLTKEQSKALEIGLESNGFEFLENKDAKLIEKIKAKIIDLIQKSKEPLKENYSEILSQHLGKDYSVLSHLFSEAGNLTIEKYIIHQKIEKVKELLVYNELSLSEIAFQLGYSSSAYLSSQFKQLTGFTPTDFKRLKHHDRRSLDMV